jgi:hypothetical protein
VVSIWFFIGISLAVNGMLTLAAGIYQVANPPANPGVVLFNLRSNVRWALLIFGLNLLFQVCAEATVLNSIYITSDFGLITTLIAREFARNDYGLR